VIRGGRFLPYVHYCRAIAIAIIVAGHCIPLFDWTDRPRTADFLSDLLANGTVVFVFLAGFLFEHLSGGYRYGPYLRKKLLHVWIPYVIISIPAIIYAVYFSDLAVANPWLAARGLPYQVAWYYKTGGAHINFPLWFIPMISLYYLAAPLFMLLVRYRKLCQLALAPLLVFSVLAHRARSPNLDTMRLAEYFLSAYVLGIWTSQNRASVERVLTWAWQGLLVLFVGFVAAQYWLSPYHGNYEGQSAFSQEHGLVDWIYLQKILLCFVMLGLTSRFQGQLTRLKYLGDISFPIFFVHGYFVSWGELTLVPKPAGSLLLFVAGSAIVFFGSVAVVYLAKLILRQHSHYVIGS
jgi:peptidoglycan/LPS O-acetylase OafA/YrhL